MGHIVIADRVKEGSAEAIAELKALGVARTVMLTGDQSAVAQSVAKELGVDEVHAELLPGDKVEQVERLMKQKPEGTMLAFVVTASTMHRCCAGLTWALPWAVSVRMPPLKRRILCLWMTIHASALAASVSPGAPCALPIRTSFSH